MNVFSKCPASQTLRTYVENGKIIDPHGVVKGRIQPSSYEPTLADYAYILDDIAGWHPQSGQTISRQMAQLPYRRRTKVSLEGGLELKVGFSYLIPLEQQLNLEEDEYVRSSPKSSCGRVFINSRLAADYNPGFDNILGRYHKGPLQTYLLVEPMAFNVIVHQGLTMNQLRFFSKQGARIGSQELREIHETTPLVWEPNEEGIYVPSNAIITEEGVQLHLDLKGRETKGVVALRARRNPHPLDLSKKAHALAEDYWEPLLAQNGTLDVEQGHFYLLATKEELRTPPNMCAEFLSHSNSGPQGIHHRAGFIDNGFVGDLVGEFSLIPPDTRRTLHDGTPLSGLAYFATEFPEAVYGSDIGSNYQGQHGPKVAKYFRGFDFDLAGKNIAKLDRNVLVQEAARIQRVRQQEEGFEMLSHRAREELERILQDGFFHSRYDCEFDREVLQPIPYVLMFGPDNTIFTYQRASDQKEYGDKRLFGKYSIGVGGHVQQTDGPDHIRNSLRRELEEEVLVQGNMSEPQLIGTLFSRRKPVDEVHLGLIYGTHVTGDVAPKESSIARGELVPIQTLHPDETFETWSQLLIPSLEAIYKLSQGE